MRLQETVTQFHRIYYLSQHSKKAKIFYAAGMIKVFYTLHLLTCHNYDYFAKLIT